VLTPAAHAPLARGAAVCLAGCCRNRHRWIGGRSGGAPSGATTGVDVGLLGAVVGAAQIVFGAGQAWLPERAPSPGWVAGEWIIFNLGNAGVIAGTLAASFGGVAAGTALFASASRCSGHA
jgi:hypothetical protein